MTADFYRVVHIVGVLMLFLGIGGMLSHTGSEGSKSPVIFTMMHGLGLLIMLVAGIGQAHKLGYGWPVWLFLKIGCWVLIAALPTLAKKGMLARPVAMLLALALGGTAILARGLQADLTAWPFDLSVTGLVGDPISAARWLLCASSITPQ